MRVHDAFPFLPPQKKKEKKEKKRNDECEKQEIGGINRECVWDKHRAIYIQNGDQTMYVIERVLAEGYDLTNARVSGGTGCPTGAGTGRE